MKVPESRKFSQHCGCVRTPSSEARPYRGPLPENDPHAVGNAKMRLQERSRLVTQVRCVTGRIRRGRGDGDPARGFELNLVVQCDAVKDGLDVMVAVGTLPANDQAEVDFGVGEEQGKNEKGKMQKEKYGKA